MEVVTMAFIELMIVMILVIMINLEYKSQQVVSIKIKS